MGGEFIISQESHGFPPDVAMDDSGDFVVNTYTDRGQGAPVSCDEQ